MQKTGTPRSPLTALAPAAGRTASTGAASPGKALRMPVPAGSPDGLQIILTERNCHVDETFRLHAQEKLGKIGKFDGKVTRVDVEVSREPNPRLADVASRVELTVSSRGPVIRAEASAGDPVVALDLAWQKLQVSLRRSHQRRVNHTLRRGPASAGGAGGRRAGRKGSAPEGAVSLPEDAAAAMPDVSALLDLPVVADDDSHTEHQRWMQDGDGPFLLREKTHTASPMTLDQALYEMELVGHDFFLFVDAGSGQPSVLYRRRGYSYGLIRLERPADPA
jgi:ribosomal subunit interface protein